MRDDRRLFEWYVMRHLDAAYNLARWYLHNEHDAEDVVQDSMIKAYQAFSSFQGVDGKPWLFRIVRNGCFRHLERQGRHRAASLEDETLIVETVGDITDPEAQLIRSVSNEQVRNAVNDLPPIYREIIVLREFEELSYSEIAEIVSIPVGTVMSRLARARAHLAKSLRAEMMEESR